MFRSQTLRARAGIAFTFTYLLGAGAAQAQDSVALTCEDYSTGASLMTGNTVMFDSIFVVTCNVDFTNNDITDRTDVHVRVSWDTTTVNPIASLLPGGVQGLVDPFSQQYSMVDVAYEEPGSPDVVFDSTLQTAEVDLGLVPALSSSELFFNWSKSSSHPVGTTGLTVDVYENGPPGVGTLIVSESYNVDFDVPTANRLVEPIPTADPEHRYVGSAFGFPFRPDAVHTNAQMKIYLPYWNGSAFVADGLFSTLDPSHVPVVDEGKLSAALALRDSSLGVTINDVMPEGTPPDSFGNRSWPTTGANANALIIYDPSTNILTGVPGLYGAGDKESSAGYSYYDESGYEETSGTGDGSGTGSYSYSYSSTG